MPITGSDGTSDRLLMALADGMGGHNGGAHASAAAVEAFVQAYAAAPEPEAEGLQRGLQTANQRIARDASADTALRGMGCTLVGVSLTEVGLHWISVGDSLLYLFRDGTLTRLNADHSMAPVIQDAILLGILSQEEAECHPNRNALRSAVMGRELSLIDLRAEPMELLPGDRLLLASDGILTLPEARISELLGQYADRTAEELCGILVDAVSSAEKLHQDNVTVLLVSLPSTGPAATKRSARLTNRLVPGRQAAEAALQWLLQPRILAMLGSGFLLAAIVIGLFGRLPVRWPWQGPGAGVPAVTTAPPGVGTELPTQPEASAGSASPEKAENKPRPEPSAEDGR